MAYQITRANRLIDTLQLIGVDGELKAEIDVNIDLSRIARDYRARVLDYEDAREGYEKARASNNTDAEKDALNSLGKAVIALYALLFGQDITRQIVDFFEGDYIEMVLQTFPFVFDVVAPAVAEYAKNQRKQIVRSKYAKKGFGKR